MQAQMNNEERQAWADARLSEWEETMMDADNELKLAREAKDRAAIKEAQEVWNWAKESLETAAARVVALRAGLNIPDLTEPTETAEVSETEEE
jgi:hypothetical protein